MNLVAYARLLHKKINSAHKQAQNPFVDCNSSYNPFAKPIYTTLVWVESDDDDKREYKE